MKKLSDTITNECRNVIDIKHAKYRANKLKVIKIINIFSLCSVKKITHHPYYSDTITVYQKNTIVYPDAYDLNLDEYCSHGIHYYKSIEAAYYHDIPENNYIGQWIEYSDDGIKYVHNIINGEHNNQSISYHPNGIVRSIETYLNNKHHGLFKRWYSNGEQELDGNFVDDYRSGTWIFWNPSGDKSKITTYCDEI